jgi:hypothetical protein
MVGDFSGYFSDSQVNACVADAKVSAVDATDLEQDVRRRRLREWVAAHGGHAAVVRDRKLTPSLASHLSQVMNGYSFGPRAARAMENRLGMSERWLDQPLDAPTPAAAPASRPPSLDAALPVVLDAIARLSGGQWRMVRARLDDLPEQPGALRQVLADVAPVMGLGSVELLDRLAKAALEAKFADARRRLNPT